MQSVIRTDLDAPAADDGVARSFVVRGNPFLLTILILSALVAAGGVWVQWLATSAMWGHVTSGIHRLEDQVLPALLGSMAPSITGIGLGVVIAMLTLYAVRWRPAK